MFSTLHLDGLHSLLYRQGKIINLCIQFYYILNQMGEAAPLWSTKFF
jgi:hypothetical protein